MTETTVSPTTATAPPVSADGSIDDTRAARLRPILWRLHFLGGFLAAPVALWLAVTGLLFTWNPQIESLLYGDRTEATAAEGEAHPLSHQLEVVTAAHPGFAVASVRPADEGGTTAVLLEPADTDFAGFGAAPGAFTVYVDPVSDEITGRIDESQRPGEWLRNLHSNFRLGPGIGTLTELAASWVVVALITGLYLWWPRSRRAWRRAMAPSLAGLRRGGRRPWRNLHSWLGVVMFGTLAVVVVTGLTWTEYAGRWVDVTKDALAVESPFLSTELATAAPEDPGATGTGAVADAAGTTDEPASHVEHADDAGAAATDLAAIDQVAAGAAAAGLSMPHTITPAAPGEAWLVAEADDRWPIERSEVAVDPATGDVVDRLEFSDQPLLDQATTLGIGFHEGTLFGLSNQITLSWLAVTLVVALVAGYMAWWRRRPAGAFGAPPRLSSVLRTVPAPLLVGFALLLVLLPTLGVTFVVYLVLERIVRAVRPPRRAALPGP
jgi:uncharacterized iron-regulated membrane protein